MSIWATILTIADDWHTAGCDRLVRDAEFEALWTVEPDRPCTCNAGPVVYQGSHVMPTDVDPRAGSFDRGEIPGYVRSDDYYAVPEPWLRFGVNQETVLLDRAQVERVSATLRAWLTATGEGAGC